MKAICRHAFKIQEKWSAPADRVVSLEDVPPHIVDEDERMRRAGWTKHVDIDDNDPSNWQCGWLVSLSAVPKPVARSAGGNSLRHGDCDTCPCFEPVVVAIPGIR